MKSRIPRGAFHIRIDLSKEDIKRLGVEFASSILKVLSNKENWEILRKIKEYGKVSSKDFRNLKFNIIRLHEHGLIILPEEKNNFLTELGEEILNSSVNLSPYLNWARRGEQNMVLLQLLVSGGEKSFSELNSELRLNVWSLHRSLENLVNLGFVSKSKDDKKYRINNEASFEPLREFCEKIIQRYQRMGLYFQDGELRASSVPEEPALLTTTQGLKYSALETVINDHIVVTYSYESKMKKEELIRKIIYEQTRWEDDICKPVLCEQVGKLQIAYNIDYIASLQHLFNLFCLHAIRDFDRLSVEEIKVPKSFCERFEYLKPRYGIDGIRKLLGIEDRPLLHVIIPSYLKRGEEVADFVQNLLEIGIDAVEDHQFTGLNLKEFQERVEKVAGVIENSSHKLLFYPYIEGEDFLEKIDVVKETKCKYLGLGLSPLSFGLPTTMFVRKNYSFPLHLHLTLHGIYTRMGQGYYSAKEGFKAGHGISSHVILKLFAFCGGDEVDVDYYGFYSIEPQEVEVQCGILRGLNVFPALVGGINLDNLRQTVIDYGKDIIIKVGGGKFLRLLRQGRIEEFKEYVGAYKRLIENTAKGKFEEDQGIIEWRRNEKERKNMIYAPKEI